MSKQVNEQLFGPGARRYNAAVPALRRTLGGPTRRIGLDAGFTCPTRDGTLGTGGCLYCDAGGARAIYVQPECSVAEQLARGIRRIPPASRDTCRIISYLQAFTNTYADPGRLRDAYEQALSDPRVAALAIGTRPDCLPEPVLDLLEEFSHRTFLWIEMGLQSTRNATLAGVHRGHTVEQFTSAAEGLNQRRIRFVSHVILGLPGDTREDMLRAPGFLNSLGSWGVKLHNLYIDRDSPLAEPYRQGLVPMLSREEYIDLVVEFLARLSPDALVHRLVGEVPADRLLAPLWAGNKQDVLRGLDKEMAARGVWQGVRAD